MVKKTNMFLIIVAIILFVYGIVLVSKPLAFEEKYKSERSATDTPIELQFYECGIVKVNSTSQFYELQESGTNGGMIVKISYDELKVVSFYKLEYTRWDVVSQSDKTTYLTCTSRLVKVVIIFVVGAVLVVYIIYKAIKWQKIDHCQRENNN